MKKWPYLFPFALGAVLLPGPAAGQVVETPHGTVEFVGLERWTVEMIRDSMAVKAPGQPLGACAAVLRQMGFPAASSRHFPGEGAKPYVLVTVVEPQHADRIRRRGPFPDSLPDHPEWKEGIDLFREHDGAFQSAVQSVGLRRDSASVRMYLAAFPDDAPGIRRYWSFLDSHRREVDLDLALRTLEADGNRVNRAVAASLLTGFGASDRVWWSLADALRDPAFPVAATASQALAGLAESAPPKVDWTPALPSLRGVLGGTNVSILDPVLDVLVRTHISPELAPALLRDGSGDLLLALLRARDPRARSRAHAFLVHLAGADLGPDPAAWERWIEGLAEPR